MGGSVATNFVRRSTVKTVLRLFIACVCAGVHVPWYTCEGQKQLAGVCSLLSRGLRLNSGGRARQKTALLEESICLSGLLR